MGMEIINKLKLENNLTNTQLAKMAGLSIHTIDNITSGNNVNPTINTAKKLCSVLGCTLNDIADMNNENPTLTLEEIKILNAYRKHPEMRLAIITLLGIKEDN